jgi:hypothetical protein
MDIKTFDELLRQVRDFYQARIDEYQSCSLEEILCARADKLVCDYDPHAGTEAANESLLDMAVCCILSTLTIPSKRRLDG